MGIQIKATIQKEPGTYPSPEIFNFESQEEYDNWFNEHNEDHRKGKILGIHSETNF